MVLYPVAAVETGVLAFSKTGSKLRYAILSFPFRLNPSESHRWPMPWIDSMRRIDGNERNSPSWPHIKNRLGEFYGFHGFESTACQYFILPSMPGDINGTRSKPQAILFGKTTSHFSPNIISVFNQPVFQPVAFFQHDAHCRRAGMMSSIQTMLSFLPACTDNP